MKNRVKYADRRKKKMYQFLPGRNRRDTFYMGTEQKRCDENLGNSYGFFGSRK